MPLKVDVDVVEARDKSILAAIDRVGGIVFAKDLRLPAGDPAAGDAVQRAEAVRMSLMRLKAKGILARTGDAWSRVGVGMMATV